MYSHLALSFRGGGQLHAINRSFDPEDVGATQRVPGDREHEVLLGRDAEDYAAPVCGYAARHPAHSDTQLRWVGGRMKDGRGGKGRGGEGRCRVFCGCAETTLEALGAPCRPRSSPAL